MRRLRVGVAGAGLIAQVEHIPNLLRLRDRFELMAVCEPSATVRGFVEQTFGVRCFATLEQLFEERLDALVIASPDPLHHELVLAGLAAGLHVLCEKPLCYSPAEIDEIVAARGKAGLIMQVGYMKRFDPHYEAALRLMPGTRETLRYIAIEVNDPDSWPFVAHHPRGGGGDVAPALIEGAKARQRHQVERALGGPVDELTFRGFTTAYSSSLVHDVNAVHGLLDGLGIAGGDIAGAQLFAGGRGGQGTVRLMGGQALWNMVHVAIPKLADYRERIAFYFEDALLELTFPSPYLNHQPTELVVSTSKGHELHRDHIRVGYREAFVEELLGFRDAIVEGAPVRNTPEQARRDQALLVGLARKHAGLD